MKLTKVSALAAVAFATLGYSQVATAGWSANVGLVSEYHFRGIQQTSDASASAGVDYESGSFYAGAWTADVGDGLEVDLYGGFGFDLTEEVSASVGFTTYQYTGDFDSEYNEVNLGLSFGMFSVEYSIGEHSADASAGIDTDSDYTFLGLTVEKNGFYGTYGSHGDDFDGDYFEVGYGTEIGGFDAGVSFIFASDDLTGAGSDENIYFSLSKGFDL